MYDVIVIGAGAAGLMAAGTAAMSGRQVLLIEEMEAAASAHGATVFLRDCQRASGAAKAAWLQAQSGALQNCHEILPAYLRLSQAERMRKERMEQ